MKKYGWTDGLRLLHTTPFKGGKNETTKNHEETQRENIFVKMFSYKKFKNILENALKCAKKNYHLNNNMFLVYIHCRVQNRTEFLNVLLIILSRCTISFLYHFSPFSFTFSLQFLFAVFFYFYFIQYGNCYFFIFLLLIEAFFNKCIIFAF